MTLDRSCKWIWFVGSLALMAGSASAQSPYSDRPTVSPYLNLLRTDQFGTILPPNYQTLVRPQLDQQQQIQQQQGQINNLQQQNRRGAPASQQRGLSSTGHRAPDFSEHRYLNYSHYYPSLNARFG